MQEWRNMYRDTHTINMYCTRLEVRMAALAPLQNKYHAKPAAQWMGMSAKVLYGKLNKKGQYHEAPRNLRWSNLQRVHRQATKQKFFWCPQGFKHNCDTN